MQKTVLFYLFLSHSTETKMKFILLSLLFSMLLFCAYGQSLHNVTLDLNVGGEVYDVTYDDTKDVYVVVGDFNSIQGQARKNLAFIDANTMQVTSNNPISSIDGHITSVEYLEVAGAIPGWFNYYLYIGGDFSMINGLARNQMARVKSSVGFFGAQPYSIDNSWSAPFEYMPPGNNGFGVNDLELNGEILVVGGHFSYNNGTDYRDNIVAFDAGSNTLSFLPTMFNSSLPEYSTGLHNIRYFDGYYYLNGTHKFNDQ